MAIPKPPIDLAGHCSAVHDNILYIFSPAGFQSIALSQNAKWQVLPSGTSVEGGVCVNAVAPGAEANNALYIVGGRSGQPGYFGLQKFVYATGQWENITPQVPVTQNRRSHGAAHLAESGNIIVYAGSQDVDNNNPSSQTFLISTAPPFNVLSFVSVAPPLTTPMLMPWNASHALMVGGAEDNKQLFLFGKDGWSNLGTSLPDPIPNHSTQCSLVTGDDGSKVLQEYNLATSPNTLKRYLLWANGQAAPAGLQIGLPINARGKRDLTANNWPAYNASGAPVASRMDYHIAQAPNGYAVISGGSTTEPIVIFHEKQNSWVDVANVFGAQTPISISTSSATSVASSSTKSSAKPTTTTPANANNAPGSTGHGIKILAAALGAVLGFAALLILLLLCLRWRSGRNKKPRQNTEVEKHDKPQRLSFGDPGFPTNTTAGNGYNKSIHDSVTSLQIFQGKLPGHRRGQKSDSSTIGLVQFKSPLGHTEHTDFAHSASDGTRVNSPLYGEDSTFTGFNRGEQVRSTGWNQYFNGNNNVTDLGAAGGQGQTFLHDSRHSARTSDISSSDYDDSRRGTQNGNIRPLELNLGPKFETRQTDRSRHDGRDSFNYVAGRAVSTGSGYEPSQYWPDNRTSQISSIMPVPPIGSGPAFGNAFARPALRTANVGQATPSASPHAPLPHSAITMHTSSSDNSSGPQPGAQDFPMPKAYLPTVEGSTARSHEMYDFTGQPRPFDLRNDQQTPRSHPKSGPVLRKMTGSEDMSWLNINAGRPI